MRDKEQLPYLFEGLVGQPLAVALLQAALEKYKIAPAYLFLGPHGVGRSFAALRFLEGVIGLDKPLARQRRRLSDGNHPDLLIIEPTYSHQGRLVPVSKADEYGVSRRTPPQIRLEQIRSISGFLSGQPLEASRGMVLIESVEAMTEGASNALLKTLEEPTNGVLILISSAPQRLLSTIRSRCQHIPFRRLNTNDLKDVLLKRRPDLFKSTSSCLDQSELVALAGGSPGAMLQQLDSFERIPNELINQLSKKLSKPKEALSLARDLTDTLNVEEQLWLIDWWQQYLWGKYSNPRPIRRLEKLRSNLLAFVQPRLAWEVTLLEIQYLY